MRRKMLFLMLLGMWVYLAGASAYALESQQSTQWEYLLEEPSWGMIEWSSATLPKGFWYPTFEFLYLANGSYFEQGREVDYEGGRDSTSYMINGSLLYGLTNDLMVGVHIPVVVGQKVDSGLYEEPVKVKSGVSNFGDIDLFLKYHLVDRYYWSLATQLGTTLPTGRPYNKAGAGKAGTGDGQVDLNFSLKGDILLNEQAFVTVDTRLAYQARREFNNAEGKSVAEKLGNVLSTEAGVVRNFKNVGLGGFLRYIYWGATERTGQPQLDPADLFEMSLHLVLGEITPHRHGKLDFWLDFPLNGKNAPATYRFGASIKSIFQ